MKTEKNVVFDDDGNPKELRYYEDGKLSARLGVILDGDKNFIGLRELDVEEVSPPSWLDRLRLRKREPTRLTIHTIDFIGLINWINTIKTIKTIENIETIKNIESIDLIDEITKITTIRDLVIPKPSLIINADFQQEALGWILENATISDVVPSGMTGGHSVKLGTDGTTGHVKQVYAQCWNTDWVQSMYVLARSLTSAKLYVFFIYEDNVNSSAQEIQLTTGWAKYVITKEANKNVMMIDVASDDAYVKHVGVLF